MSDDKQATVALIAASVMDELYPHILRAISNALEGEIDSKDVEDLQKNDKAKTYGQLINEMAPGQFLQLDKVTPAGSLQARKLSNGVVLYWRITINGKSHREAIGPYDSSAPPKSLKPTPKGYSVAAAMDAAQVLAIKHKNAIKESKGAK